MLELLDGLVIKKVFCGRHGFKETLERGISVVVTHHYPKL